LSSSIAPASNADNKGSEPVAEASDVPEAPATTGGESIDPAVNGTSETINPNLYYSVEPAPMGLTDYGINPNTMTPYMYSTTSFLGTVDINSLVIHNLTGSNNGWASIQLNTVLKYNLNGVNYSYWLQNVMQIYAPPAASFAQVTFLDNIWNDSSSYANMSDSWLFESSGSIGSIMSGSHNITYYYDRSIYDYPDYDNLVFPSTVQIEINSSYQQIYGAPEVLFAYNLGYGWITYDDMWFDMCLFAPFTTYNLVVDGTQYTPTLNFYDAELVLAGVAGGTYTNDAGSNMNFVLDYFIAFESDTT
jgi:thermopsin